MNIALSPQQLGWVAGVLDLKGKIVRKENRDRATPQYVLVVDSKEPLIIKRLCSLTGTNSEWKRERKTPDWMRRRCNDHCPDKHEHVSSHEWKMPSMHRWTATGAAAAVILHNISEFSETRERHAQVLTELIENARLHGQGSGATTAALLRMHNLGWSLPKRFTEALQPNE